MFGSNILDVTIGLASLFLLLSLIASAVNELIEGWWKKRARDLEKGIIELVGNENAGNFVDQIYNHGLINCLFRGRYTKDIAKKDLPSYIPSLNFALAIMDITKNLPSGDDANLPDNVKTALRAFKTTAVDDVAKLQKSIEDWYNSAMDRVSGWYKRRSQYFVFGIGFVLAVLANADCIDYAKRLSTDASLRQSAVAFAEATAKTDPLKDGKSTSVESIRNEMKSLNGIGLPIGWTYNDVSLEAFGRHLFGWILTALAVSLGAPFWFDILNKIMVIRSTVKPHEKSREEGSKDLSKK